MAHWIIQMSFLNYVIAQDKVKLNNMNKVNDYICEVWVAIIFPSMWILSHNTVVCMKIP